MSHKKQVVNNVVILTKHPVFIDDMVICYLSNKNKAQSLAYH